MQMTNETILYIGSGLIAILMFVAIYVFNRPVNKEIVCDSETLKKEAVEKEIKQKRKTFDRQLYYSGISKKFGFINKEWYAIISAMAGVAAAACGYLYTHSIPVCGALSAVAVSAMYMLVIILAEFTNKRAECQLVRFANLVDNFSSGNNGDLTSLLESTLAYLDNPLHDAIADYVDEVAVTGDREGAAQRLKDKIETPLFSDIISNLVISSRHECNYKEVIKSFRPILKSHSATIQNKKSMVGTARTNMVFLLLITALIINMVQGLIGDNIMDILTGTPAGMVVIAIIVAIIIVIIAIYVSIGRTKG